MVDYKGDLLVANATTNSDLFWATCGGGGGNFGIVTKVTVKIAPIPELFPSFEFSIPPSQAAEFLVYWQTNVSTQSPKTLALVAWPGADGVDVYGQYNGTMADLEAALNQAGLGEAGKYARENFKSKMTTWLDSVVDQAGMDSVTSPADLNNVAAITSGRAYAKLKSFFIMPDKQLGPRQMQKILDWVTRAEGTGGYVEMNILGPKGSISDKSSTDTAFPYREALISVLYGAEWEDSSDTAANIALVNELESQLKSALGYAPPAYINYIDGTVPLVSYYGPENLKRLEQVKEKYDPQNYFQNPMSVPEPSKEDDRGILVPSPSAPGVVGESDGSPSSEQTTSGSWNRGSGTFQSLFLVLCVLLPAGVLMRE